MSVTSVSFAFVPVPRFPFQRRAASVTAAGVRPAEIPVESGAVGENCFEAHSAEGEVLKALSELFGVICRVSDLRDQLFGDHFQPDDLVGPPAGDVGHASRSEVARGVQSCVDQPIAHPGSAGHAPADLEFAKLGAPAPVFLR